MVRSQDHRVRWVVSVGLPLGTFSRFIHPSLALHLLCTHLPLPFPPKNFQGDLGTYILEPYGIDVCHLSWPGFDVASNRVSLVTGCMWSIALLASRVSAGSQLALGDHGH